MTKLGLQELPPLTLTALRYLAAAPCFLVFILTRSRPPLRALLGMMGLGIGGVGLGQTLQALGVERTSASVATVITAIIPILVVLLAALRLGQALRLRHGFGLATAFLGIALVAINDPRNILVALAGGSLEGDALMLLSALAISGYYGFSIELVSRYSATTVASWTSLAGAAALTPFMLWELRTEPATIGIEGIGAVLYLGLLVTVLGVWIWLRALTRVPARVAASLQYLQP
ncbi:MAG TPA: DMT family transporter, partial [Stellaceae bacterium]|nr:DMT family transporter [Stellaceae bacterium]